MTQPAASEYKSDSPVRVRIAPSPTGDPHVGTAYIALFNYALAKRHGGKFVLRIEDTDRARSSTESENAIFRALQWLGLSWDEGPDVGGPYGPYRQSERASIYREHADILLRRGEAYRCFCSSERLAEVRQSRKGAATGYDRLCRDIDLARSDARAAAGEAHTVRLKMPLQGECVIDDQVRGEIRVAFAQSDDQVLLKSDGMPTYHLANVVDDHLMKISHVIRAEEWISSTPKHIRLYQAFGWQPPRFCHMPLLRNNDKNKSKISKRRNPVSLDYYRDVGVLPQALVNFLALMGWSFGDDVEKFTLEQMVERIEVAQGAIKLSGPVFDLAKLNWLNSLYLRELDDEQLADALIAWRFNRDFFLRLAPLVRERIQRYDEFAPLTTYFFSGDVDYTALGNKMLPKKRDRKETTKMLTKLCDELDGLRSFEAEKTLEPFFRGFCERHEWSTRELFMLLRYAMTGRKASPPLFETMELIGRQNCRRRLREALKFIKQLPA